MIVNQIACPRCSQLTNADLRVCENCRVDLAYAAVLTEKTYSYPSDFPEGVPLVPEVLVPKLGNYLIEKGLLHPEDIKKALDYQLQKTDSGEPCLIGQALIDLDLLDRATLDKAVTEQIFELQSALHQANNQLELRVKERTSELQQALNKLTELNRLKSNFISNISHELRTPLTHIKGYLDMLAEGSLGPLTTQQSEALSVLLRAEARLERLIEDLIQFSLAARGDLNIQPNPFSLKGLLEISISQITNRAKDNQLVIKSTIDNQLPLVSADEEKISWVLMQLLDNAVKFTPEGGNIKVSAFTDDRLVIVTIADSGIGIPEKRIPEIFEPFHQLDSSITRQYEGTGLGLTMVHRILEAHGSTLGVESVVGIGSRFSFSLPIANDRHD